MAKISQTWTQHTAWNILSSRFDIRSNFFSSNLSQSLYETWIWMYSFNQNFWVMLISHPSWSGSNNVPEFSKESYFSRLKSQLPFVLEAGFQELLASMFWRFVLIWSWQSKLRYNYLGFARSFLFSVCFSDHCSHFISDFGWALISKCH